MALHRLQEFRSRPRPSKVIQPAPVQTIELTDPQIRDPAIVITRDTVTPFAALDIWPSVNGATIVTWQPNPLFKEPLSDNTELILEFSYDLSPDSWILVTVCPITYFLTDSVPRFRGQAIAGAYRLRLRCGDTEYTSEPTSLFKKLSFTEYRTALKIIRAENRQLYHKSPGYLLKRKHFGVRCTSCNDPLSNVATKDTCRICYGTGFVGGYYKPVPCGMEITLSDSNDRVDPARGPVNDGQSQGRIVALYSPEQNDVWVDSTTGSRYRVVSHKVICHQRSIPLVLMVQLKHIPASDAVYRCRVEL